MTKPIFQKVVRSQTLPLVRPVVSHYASFQNFPFLMFFDASLPSFSVTTSTPSPLGQYLAQSLFQHPCFLITAQLTSAQWFWVEATPCSFSLPLFRHLQPFMMIFSKCLSIFYPPSTPKFFVVCTSLYILGFASRKRSHTLLNFSSLRSSFTRPLVSYKISHSMLVFCLQNPYSIFQFTSELSILTFILLDPVTSPTCAISNYKSFIPKVVSIPSTIPDRVFLLQLMRWCPSSRYSLEKDPNLGTFSGCITFVRTTSLIAFSFYSKKMNWMSLSSPRKWDTLMCLSNV